MKQELKKTLRLGASLVGTLRATPEPAFRILTYHSVGSRPHEMNVSPETFRHHMEWLHAHCTCSDLSGVTTSSEAVAITLDDGYRDNLLYAAPILAELDLPATVFVVAGRAGAYLDHDRRDESARLLQWAEIRELESMGIAIGAHTLNHARLSMLDEQEQREEIAGCTRRLEDELGHAVEAFAYPYGSSLDFDERSIEIVRESGYKIALTNRYGVNRPGDDPFTLRRINIDSTDTLGAVAAKVTGRLDALAWAESNLGLRARKFGNKLLRSR